MAQPQTYIPKALLRRRSKPLLLWLAPPFLVLAGIMPAAFVVAAAFSLDSGTLSVQDQPLANNGFIAFVLPVCIAIAVTQLTAAYGLLAERRWARLLLTHGSVGNMLLFTLACGAAGADLIPLLRSQWLSVPIIAVTYWYFYRYGVVVEYYRSLQRRAVS